MPSPTMYDNQSPIMDISTNSSRIEYRFVVIFVIFR